MAPLYAYNFARVDFMREFMKDFNSEGGGYQHSKPFNNLAVIDVGCGGGLLTEVSTVENQWHSLMNVCE